MRREETNMPKGPPPLQTRRDCRFDHLVAAAIAKGYGVVLVYSGIETLERAHEIRRGIYRCAKHREVSADAGLSGKLAEDDAMGVRAVGNEYALHFRVFGKGSARKRHIERYGTDRSAWPYDPRRPKSTEDTDYWATLGLNEKGHRVR